LDSYNFIIPDALSASEFWEFAAGSIDPCLASSTYFRRARSFCSGVIALACLSDSLGVIPRIVYCIRMTLKRQWKAQAQVAQGTPHHFPNLNISLAT
jgi:hypothetical protein